MKIFFVIASFFSAIVSFVMLYIALDHNPMETYCKYASAGECTPVLSSLSGLWLTWFTTTFVIFTPIIYAAISILKKLFKGNADKKNLGR